MVTNFKSININPFDSSSCYFYNSLFTKFDLCVPLQLAGLQEI